jgi:hypothetical protein
MVSDLTPGVDPVTRLLDAPLGIARFASNETAQPFSEAGQEAALNLLNKALDALEHGDRVRATRLVERAARLPFDDHEEVRPGWFQAHMLLFDAVSDAAEEAEPGDARWLDAALGATEGAGDDGLADMLDVLRTIDHDYGVPPRESRRIRRKVAEFRIRDEEVAGRIDRGETDEISAVLEILEVLLRFDEAVLVEPAE